MTQRLLLSLFFMASARLLFGQDEPDKNSLAPCGTAPVIDPWFLAFTKYPVAVPDFNDTLYTALQIHLVAKDNGTGRFSFERTLNAFCRLNEDYAPSGIQFYFKNDWDLINNSAWYQHSTVPQGIQMMLANNVPDALNTYFVSDPAGNCGYNVPYAGVAIAHSCAGSTDNTWAHEAGHALSLPHPFIGWEGKTYNPANPTPDTLTYDYTNFHSAPDTIMPAPPDTALVEYVDGTNCGIAADRFCDTKPDYLSYRWDCDAQKRSLVQQKDPVGAAFYSDGTLYMSYSLDHCQTRFSDGQIQAMRANLLINKSNWLTTQAPGAVITDLPSLLLPEDNQTVPVTGAVFQWSAVPGATHYLLQGSRLSTFAVRDIEMIVTDTFATAGALLPNLTYYWRVRPFNAGFACTAFTPSHKIKTAPVSGLGALHPAGWRCYPTLLAPGQALRIEIPESWQPQAGSIAVYDAAGRQCWISKISFADRRTDLALPSGNWPAGVYYLLCASPEGVARQTLVLQAE